MRLLGPKLRLLTFQSDPGSLLGGDFPLASHGVWKPGPAASGGQAWAARPLRCFPQELSGLCPKIWGCEGCWVVFVPCSRGLNGMGP